ncbi:hypothetical protein OHB12_06275 [Nocardia sp. NBC_01730]|uniref:hypothetical protein n=1 Tax=Nocardia sp. NBC_01730 TaxID=2975998 RepID=UPI002E0FF0D0|nr:hypothetical protein OHB12_06275 [Nocardia sp. NBC_01730]
MAIDANSRSMTSGVAWRAGREEQAWQLNWFTYRLTREQARAGIDLSELLSASARQQPRRPTRAPT